MPKAGLTMTSKSARMSTAKTRKEPGLARANSSPAAVGATEQAPDSRIASDTTTLPRRLSLPAGHKGRVSLSLTPRQDPAPFYLHGWI